MCDVKLLSNSMRSICSQYERKKKHYLICLVFCSCFLLPTFFFFRLLIRYIHMCAYIFYCTLCYFRFCFLVALLFTLKWIFCFFTRKIKRSCMCVAVQCYVYIFNFDECNNCFIIYYMITSFSSSSFVVIFFFAPRLQFATQIKCIHCLYSGADCLS